MVLTGPHRRKPDLILNKQQDTKPLPGDMYYWGVWHGLHPFEMFETIRARFMSEYGFQSFPDFETVQKYTLPEDYTIESEVMAAHQRSGIGNLRIKDYMKLYFEVPTGVRRLFIPKSGASGIRDAHGD